MGNVYASLDADDDVLSVGINRAVDVLAKKLAGIRTLGPHPKDGESVAVRRGRFGPYVQHGRTIATLPKGMAAESVTLDEAVALLAEKGKPLGVRKGSPKGAGRTAKAAPPRREAAEESGGLERDGIARAHPSHSSVLFSP